MREIDHIRSGLADAEPIDLAFKLPREIVTAIGAGWGGGERNQQREHGEHGICEQVLHRELPEAH